MYARQPGSANPIGSGRSQTPSSSVPTTHTVVSVGPYQLWKRRPPVAQRATCSGSAYRPP